MVMGIGRQNRGVRFIAIFHGDPRGTEALLLATRRTIAVRQRFVRCARPKGSRPNNLARVRLFVECGLSSVSCRQYKGELSICRAHPEDKAERNDT